MRRRELTINEENITEFLDNKDEILSNPHPQQRISSPPSPPVPTEDTEVIQYIIETAENNNYNINYHNYFEESKMCSSKERNQKKKIIMKDEQQIQSKIEELKKGIGEISREVKNSRERGKIMEQVQREVYLSFEFPSDFVFFVQQRNRTTQPPTAYDITLFRTLFDPSFVSHIIRSLRSLRPITLISPHKRTFNGIDLVNWMLEYVPELKNNYKNVVYYCEYLYQRHFVFRPTSPINFFIPEEMYSLVGKKRVVIIGGGFGGCHLAKNLLLDNNYEVVLISEKDEFECIPSFPFIIGKPSYVNRIRCPYSKFLPKAKILKGKVIALNQSHVYLADSSYLSFDYCVVASGSYYDMPFKGEGVFNPTKSEDMIAATEMLNNASSAVVIGSGSVGIEVAGEIAVKYPNIQISVVSSSLCILDRIPKAHVTAMNFFCTLPNVQFTFGDRVKSYERSSCTISTHNGIHLKGEVVIPCVGFKPNTLFMREEMSENLTKEGFVSVIHTLQLIDCPHMFAIGDVITGDVEKLAQNAEIHADIVAKNIRAIDVGKPLVSYDPTSKMMLISMGPKRCLLANRDSVITEGITTRYLKTVVEKKVMMQFS